MKTKALCKPLHSSVPLETIFINFNKTLIFQENFSRGWVGRVALPAQTATSLHECMVTAWAMAPVSLARVNAVYIVRARSGVPFQFKMFLFSALYINIFNFNLFNNTKEIGN